MLASCAHWMRYSEGSLSMLFVQFKLFTSFKILIDENRLLSSRELRAFK